MGGRLGRPPTARSTTRLPAQLTHAQARQELTLWTLPGGLDVVNDVGRRTLLVVGGFVLVVTGAVSGWLAVRSSGGATGLCASPPTGLRERSYPKSRQTEATVVLTNFRFGRVDDFYGIGASAGRHWPRGGITIAVINEGPDATPPVRQALRVQRADFRGMEGSTWPAALVAVRSQGRSLVAYAEVRDATPAAIATVNHGLARVRVCSA